MGSIAITPFKAKGFQREVGTTHKNLGFNVTGATNSGAGAAQIKVFNNGDSSTVIDWTSVDISGGNGAKTLTIPQGGPYKGIARLTAEPSTTATQTNEWNVGKGGLGIGQSLAEIFANTPITPTNLTLSAVSRMWDGDNSAHNATQTWITPPGSGLRAMVNLAFSGDQVPINIGSYAVGGTNITDWISTLLPAALTAFDAESDDIEFVLWCQGEANIGDSAATHLAHLIRSTT
jgi:hypothetical protein